MKYTEKRADFCILPINSLSLSYENTINQPYKRAFQKRHP